MLEDAAAVAEAGARHVAAALAEEPAMAVAVATGRSPIRLYHRLAALRATGRANVDALVAFQLDTYLGVPDDDPRSLWGWMERDFLDPLGIGPERRRKLDPLAADPDAECARHEADVAAAGGLGLAILGLGPNGHLGFNEPPSGPDAPSRAVRLTPETLASNASYWEGAVPERGMTLGIAPLLAARRVLLIVTGAHKRDVLRRTLDEPPSAKLPASWLRAHPRTLVLADRAARGGADA